MVNTVDELQKEIEALRERLNEYEQIIIDISAPIIPSIVPETILVPVTGILLPERFERIISKLLNYCSGKEITTVVLDFSAISQKEIGDLDIFGHYINNLTASLNLVGVEVMYVGFSPSITQNLIISGLSTDAEIKTFMSFKKALQFLMKQKGLEMQGF